MILSILRKNYKVVLFVFFTIFVAFVGHELFAIYIYKRADNDELKSVIIFKDVHISLKEFRNLVKMLDENMRRSYGISKNVKIIFDNSKNCVDFIINSQAYITIAKNLHFIVSNTEANNLLKDSLYGQLDGGGIQEKERKKNIEEISNKITKIQQSEVMRDSFMYSVQKTTEKKNQQKIDNLLKNMHIYNDIEYKQACRLLNSKIDLEYLYVPVTDKQMELLNINNKDIEPKNNDIEEYIKEHHYDYRKKERYRIYYFLYDYELSQEDIETNKKFIAKLASKFKNTNLSDDYFIEIHNYKNKNKGKKKDVKTVDFDSLPEVIKTAEKVSTGDVFFDIAQTSADMNIIYKVTDIVSDNDDTKKYTIVSIYLQPYISTATKDNMLNVVSEDVQSITTPQVMKVRSEEENRTLYDKVFEPTSKSIDNIEGGRDFIVEINKKCDGKYGQNGILRLEPRKQANNILFGFIVEHLENGTVKVDDDEEKVIKKIKNDIMNKNKCNLILDKLSQDKIKNLSFDDIKSKIDNKDMQLNYIQYGSDTVDLSYLRLTDFGKCNVKFFSLLKEGDDTGFIRMDSGIIRVRVKKCNNVIKSKDLNKDFYDKQKTEQQKDSALTVEQFSQFFNVKNKINNYI